mgnify:CR=1 FL=1
MISRFFKVIVFSTVLIFALPAYCEPVYKWENPDSGVPFYSTDKANEKFEKTELPEINRAEMQLLPAEKKTCNGHSGIDCSVGSDVDGSVICKDQFRDSVERFAYMCKYASLTINTIGDKTKDKTIIVYIRNSKPVSAMKPVVKYTSDLGYTASLAGPDEIMPYSTGEFELQAQDAIIVGSKLDETRFSITCDNCDNKAPEQSKTQDKTEPPATPVGVSK